MTVPGDLGAAVTTGVRVLTVVPVVAGAVGSTDVVDVESTVEDVDADGDVLVVPTVVVVGRAVVTGELVATCRLGDVSLPVATSKSSVARATAARP